ncbi:MAG TPA: lipocalin family protein [Gillisia sp.]|nr:lipocalin family protein [Gillisia sp.]
MKKFLILILFAATFIACSNDDDADTSGDDPIVGTWVMVDATAPLNTIFCETPQSNISFEEDNTGEATFYLTEDNCEPEITTGNWRNNGNGSYSIVLPVVGELTGNVSFTGDDQFSFASAGGTLSFERI